MTHGDPRATVDPRRVRILVVVNEDRSGNAIRGILEASTRPPFQVSSAANGWGAQRQATNGEYAALIVDDTLTDTDGETLLGRLKAVGVRAPALVLTSLHNEQVTGAGDDYLPRTEALQGITLVRVIVGMVQRHALKEELASAREHAERVTALANALAHDLATPLGVVIGMTQILLADDHGLNADGQACLEDVAGAAIRTGEILKHFHIVEPLSARDSALVAQVPPSSVRRPRQEKRARWS